MTATLSTSKPQWPGKGHLEALAAAADGSESEGFLPALVAGQTVCLIVNAVARCIVAIHKQLPVVTVNVDNLLPPPR
jgi:hypothetical protein